MFDIAKFKSLLNANWVGSEFSFIEQTKSTNLVAKKLENPTPGTVILTEDQTAGKGQHNRLWITEKGKNLTFSLIFTPSNAERINLLTLSCASAIEDIICKYYDHCSIELKWPNDVICDGKKIAGLLTEVIHYGNKVDRVIVGIGLNVNQEKFSGEISELASSIRNLTGKEESREQLLADILARIEYNYQRWANNSVDLIKEVNEKLQGFGKWVTLEVDGKRYEDQSKFLGMNEKGALQVLNKELGVDIFTYEQIRVHIH